ncbi:unnamed protein product, partial [Bubo scandiacus]
GHAEVVDIHSSPGDAADCNHLGLAYVVSAWPCSPCTVGAKRDRQGAYWLWTGAAAAEAEEARLKAKKKSTTNVHRRGRVRHQQHGTTA